MDTVAQKRYAQSLFQAATREAYTCPRTQTERKKRSSSPFKSKINSHATIEKEFWKKERKKRKGEEEMKSCVSHTFMPLAFFSDGTSGMTASTGRFLGDSITSPAINEGSIVWLCAKVSRRNV